MTWNQALISGKAKSKAEIARAEGVSPRYMNRPGYSGDPFD